MEGCAGLKEIGGGGVGASEEVLLKLKGPSLVL